VPDNNPNRMHGTLHQIILNYFCGAQAPIKRAAVPAGHGGRPVLVPVGYVGYLNTQMRRKDQTGIVRLNEVGRSNSPNPITDWAKFVVLLGK